MKKTNFKAADFSAKEMLTSTAQKTVKGGTNTIIIVDVLAFRAANTKRGNIIIDDVLQF
jgi:hypothetical protein